MATNQFIALAAAALSLVLGVVSRPVSIDHALALRGGATPFDLPGYPVTISTPGSYRLSSDLRVPPHADGIVVRAPDVTLDLNGHTVSGPVRCVRAAADRAVACDWQVEPVLRSGIDTVVAPRSLVRNGVVQGFAGAGVRLGAAAVLENLEISSNADAGIIGPATADAGLVRDVLVHHNGGAGIHCDRMRVERSSFVDNGGNGVECRRAIFADSVSRGNGGYGVADHLEPGLRSIDNRQGNVLSMADRR